MAVWGMGVMVGPILGPTLGGWLTDSYTGAGYFSSTSPWGAGHLWNVEIHPPVPGARRMRFDVFGLRHLKSGDRCAAIAARTAVSRTIGFPRPRLEGISDLRRVLVVSRQTVCLCLNISAVVSGVAGW